MVVLTWVRLKVGGCKGLYGKENGGGNCQAKRLY